MANIGSRLDTVNPLLSDLIADVRNGQIKIPQFQRRFIWKSEQALALLDSIANNYPIGSLLLWRTNSRLVTERNIGDFQLPKTADMFPTDYVLDGQQRLTVIYSSLGAPLETPGFQAAYDLSTAAFVEMQPGAGPTLLPLRWIFNTSKFLDVRTALRGIPDGDRLSGRLDQLFQVVNSYRVPTVVLKELSVEEVCPIFERINSSGTHLSTYDLMVAATWEKDAFDLNTESDAIRDALREKDFGDIDGDTILKCLAAVNKGSIKKSDLLGLRKLDRPAMDKVVAKSKDALLRAVDTLVTEFGVYSWDFLPYEALLVVLVYVYSRNPTLTAPQQRRLRQWFWRASLSERYRVGGEAFVSGDLTGVHEFVVHGTGEASSFGQPPSAATWTYAAFRSNNSRSRAFVLALSRLKPMNLTNGATIDIAVALSMWNRREFHHVYPRAHLKRIAAAEEHNAIANICLLASSENKVIGDTAPSVYFTRLVAEHGSKATDILRSNALPLPDTFSYETAGYGQFLAARAAIVNGVVMSLCDGDFP